jgi:uncharacterized metal-binding protein YceD (DUF177 family)
MSHRREYEIPFVGLKLGLHVFEYEIDDKFFASYGEQDFTNCHTEVKLSFDKKNGFMQLHFDINGSVDVICDKCGNTLNKQLWDEFDIIVKMVEEPKLMNEKDTDPDIYYISRSESHLDIADWMYEFINLSLPFQKRCSEEDEGGSQCNIEVLDKLKKMEEEATHTSNDIWKDLEKFKNLNT